MSNMTLRKSLQDINKKKFIPRSVILELLKDCPQTIPVLAQWIYDEWHPYDATLTKEKLLHSLSKRLNDCEIPFTLVAIKNKVPIGMITLKDKGEPEFLEFGKGFPWLGSFHVAPEERNMGLGTDLLTAVKTIAENLGHKKIFLYTSNPLNVDWYLERGASLIETRPFRGHTITLMSIP